MIYGIGNDICDLRRLRDTVQRQGERFAAKILGPDELRVYHQRAEKNPSRAISYLATRFAAKEALSKALGLGMRLPMAWQACEILNDADTGKPVLVLHGELAAWFQAQGLQAHVSLSDETDYATAFVVLEKT